jgi:hypothetical protein
MTHHVDREIRRDILVPLLMPAAGGAGIRAEGTS